MTVHNNVFARLNKGDLDPMEDKRNWQIGWRWCGAWGILVNILDKKLGGNGMMI